MLPSDASQRPRASAPEELRGRVRAGRPSRWVRWLGGCLALMPLGCSVEALNDADTRASRNHCEESSDCGSGARCNSRGTCEATQGELGSILLEISPPQDSGTVGGARYVKVLTVLPQPGGLMDIQLEHLTTVSGTINHPEFSEACFGEAPGNQPPTFNIRLTPSQQVLGLPSTVYSVVAHRIEAGVSAFNIELPPGFYDIYLVPASQAEGCGVPPRMLRSQRLPKDGAALARNVEFNLALSEPASFTARVEYPAANGDLEGWTLDLVDPESALVLSTKAVLSSPTLDESLAPAQLVYEATVNYASVTGVEVQPGSEFVRLTPPQGVVAATLFLNREALEGLAAEGPPVIDHLQRLQRPRAVQATVVRNVPEEFSGNSSMLSVPATVTVTSQSLQPGGANASYTALLETDEDGQFEVELPPGSYEAVAVPLDNAELAAGRADWRLNELAAVQEGLSIVVESMRIVHGTLRTPQGDLASGLPMHLGAAPRAILTGVLGPDATTSRYVPRATTAVRTEDGHFELSADPGTFDLSVRPDPVSGYGWLVKLGLEVDRATPLGELRMRHPVRYVGSVTSPDVGPLADTLMRAYVGLNERGEPVDFVDESDAASDPASVVMSVVQVAETRTDSNGDFQLYLPPSIDLFESATPEP